MFCGVFQKRFGGRSQKVSRDFELSTVSEAFQGIEGGLRAFEGISRGFRRFQKHARESQGVSRDLMGRFRTY